MHHNDYRPAGGTGPVSNSASRQRDALLLLFAGYLLLLKDTIPAEDLPAQDLEPLFVLSVFLALVAGLRLVTRWADSNDLDRSEP